VSTQSSNIPPRTQIDPLNVPEPFRPLIPYAERWGISYTYVDKAINEASIDELKELMTTVSEFNAEGFDEWLGNPGKDNYTKEWRAFILLIDACDLIKLRLRSEIDNESID